MRITVESTEFLEQGPNKASVEISDESTIDEVMDAVYRVLVGYGFHTNTVVEGFLSQSEGYNDK